MRTVQLLRLLTRSALAFLFLVLVTGSAAVLAQKTIYVDTGGNDGFNGLTPATAKQTFAGALAIADPGDTISAEAGTYSASVTITIDDLTIESRPDGLITTVEIDGDLTNDADGTSIGESGDGNFSLTGDLTLLSGSLAVDDFALSDDVTITRTAGTIAGNIGFPSGKINVVYDGDEDVTSGPELPADLNAGDLSVELDEATLTLAVAVEVDDLNVIADAVVVGTVILGGAPGADLPHSVTGTGTVGTLIVQQATEIEDAITLTGTLDIRNGGEVELQDDVTVGAVMLVTGGSLDIDQNQLSVTGNFTRTGGLIAFDAGGILAFTGEGDATFAGGPNLIVLNLLVDKDGTVMFTQDVNITNSLEVTDGSTANFGARTVTVSTDGTVTVDGALTQTEGVLLFTAPDAVIQGAGEFGSVTVLLGPGNDDEDIFLGSDVVFSGVLSLLQGGVDTDGNDLSPVGDDARVVVDLTSSGANIDGSFNAEENEFDLEYTGDLGGGSFTVGDEFTLGFVRNITISAEDGEVDASGADGGDILGNLVINGVAAADAVTLTLPEDDITIIGNLQVGANTTVDTGGDDTVALTLQGAANSVAGLIVGDATLVLDGEGIAVAGSTEEDDDAAELPAVTVTEGSSATLTNIQVIDGLVTLEDESSLSLGMADEMEVTGGFDVGADASLTLTTDVNVTGGDFAGAEGASYGGSGTLVLDGAVNLGTEGESIPNVEVVQGVTLTSDVEIGNSLVVNDEIDLDGNVLTVNNALETDGGTIASDGEVVFVSTTATLGGDATIDADVEIAGATLTLVSDDGETARTLTITGDVALNGPLNLGINNLELDGGDLTSDGGSITASTGAVIVSDAATIDPDGSLTIPSLEVGAATTVDGGTLRVTTVLDLGAGLSLNDADDDALAIGPGTLIILNAVNPLGATEPDFEGSVNIEVNVAQTSGNELAETVGSLWVNDDYDVASDVTVTTLLSLDADLDDAAGGEVTLGPGATLSLEPGYSLSATLAATTYNLTYAAGSQLTSDDEFIAGAEVVTLTSHVGAANTLTFHDDLTVTNIVQQSGSLDFDDNDLEVMGNATLNFANIPATNSLLSFTGSGDHTLTVAGNSVVPDGMDIEIAKNSSVTLTGGNLNFRTNLQTLILTSGEFNTSATASIILFQDATTQGFTREEGTITGNVQKRLYEGDPFGTIPAGEPGATLQRSARFEFPTGAPGGDYRPMALTFLNSIEQRTDLTVRHVPQSPGGTAGLPLDGGDGVTVSGYPNFYWFVGASQSLGQAQSFNVEVTGTQLGVDIEDVEDLRIIRRFDPSPLNPWVLQGTAANYSNVVVGDDDALVRVTGSTGGIVTQGSRFTIGRTALPPTLAYEVDGEFVDLDGAVVQAAAGMTTEVNLQFSSQDVGQEATIELVDAPEWVTLEDVTGETAVISITPPVEEVGNEHEVTVAVTDPDDTVQATFTIFVVEEVLEFVVSGQPAASTTLEPGDEFSFTLTAAGGVGDVEFVLDPDDVENVTFSAEGRSATFTFAPDEDQVDETFAFSIEVTDEADNSETVEFEVTVELIPLVLGDPDRDQEVTSADASLILQAVVGLVQLSPRDEERADVSGDGSVSAFDAGLILQFLVEFIDCFPADPDCEPAGKTINPGNGDLAWGEIDRGEELTVHVPLKLTGNVSGVHAIELAANVDLGRATVAGFSGTNLPDGWQIAWKIAESGELRIAMAGATPLDHAGEIGRIAFRLEDESSTVGVTAEGRINERAFNHLGAAGVQEIPSEFALGSNYPNPFNPSTTFTYSLPETGKVLIQIYDVTGRRVRMLVNEERQAGVHSVMWDGRNDAGLQVASGMYVYQIRSGSFVQAKKMMLVK